MGKEKWIKGIKLTAGAILAIVLANLMGLKFSATAGIITILSIQNTKKETFRLACRRGIAFLCALGLAAAAFHFLGFTVASFALYLFGFSCVCLYFGWTEAIAMDSVLITHFLTEGNMELSLVVNEVCLFLLGTGMGILANLHLHKRPLLYDEMARRVDSQIKAALKRIEKQLRSGKEGAQSQETETEACLSQLDAALADLRDCAYQNWNNSLFQKSVYELEYAGMRSRQSEVLRRIYASVKMMGSVPVQLEKVAALIAQIEIEYDRENTVESLMERLWELYEEMRHEPLPVAREEFETRAVLFYLLKQLEEFLQLKKDFAAEFSL